MFIEEVISRIWQPVTNRYKECYDEAVRCNPEELYNNIVSDMNKKNNTTDKWINITILETSGCPHCNRNGIFLGCSFCDYFSRNIAGYAKMAALNKIDSNLYAKAVRRKFEQQRGVLVDPGVSELISGHDCLNPEELTDEAFDEMFNQGNLFNRKAMFFYLETRASSINEKKLAKLKGKIGRKVVIEFGAEVANEWIRNHWLNKGITDENIYSAIENIRRIGFFSNANILIGIPGMNGRQSLELFKDTFDILDTAGADYILCSPLIRQGYTMQNYLFQEFRDNPTLIETGVTRGNSTGLPEIFTVFDAIFWVISERSESLKKLILGPVFFPPYLNFIQNLYKGDPNENIVNKVLLAIEKFNEQRDYSELIKIRKEVLDSSYYNEYKRRMENLQGKEGIQETFSTVAEEISKKMWPEQWRTKFEIFKSELLEYK
jgi:radical SAM enzyme (TIGR01210 family)